MFCKTDQTNQPSVSIRGAETSVAQNIKNKKKMHTLLPTNAKSFKSIKIHERQYKFTLMCFVYCEKQTNIVFMIKILIARSSYKFCTSLWVIFLSSFDSVRHYFLF